MYRVMAVDDEIWVLRGLKRFIDWESQGFTVVSTFTDPQKAYLTFQEDPADVVFVDIRMAGIDGLTLIEMMRGCRRETQFVILSAHSQFDYAKRAISLGVADYLVKPITREALLQMLKVLRARLDEARTQAERSRLYDCLMRPDFVITPQTFQALTGFGADTGSVLGAFCWEKADFVPEVREGGLNVFGSSDGRVSYALCQVMPEEWERLCADMDTAARQACLSIGGSEAFRDCAAVHRALDCAQRGASQPFFTRANGLYRVSFEHVTPPEIEGVLQMVRAGGYEAAAHVLEEWEGTRCAKTWDVSDALYLYREAAHMLQAGAGVGAAAAKARLITSPQAMVQTFGNFETLRANLCAMLLGAGASSGTLEIMRVEEYIGAHYTQAVTVQQIACAFHVDPEHLGRMYRKKLGKSIHQSISEKRIDYACRLLRTSEIAVQEVAGLSGFSDPFYFNKVFKKTVGMTPSQYRTAEKHQK